MPSTLKIAVWNANGLCRHAQEIKTFLNLQNIDIMLISETHFTSKSYLKIPNYTIYNTNHPDGRARGGSAIIIKSSIKHEENIKYNLDYLQATSVEVEVCHKKLNVAALYCPPRYSITKENFINFFKTLGHSFIAGGDYNAKHTQWGSRLITPKGRSLLAAMNEENFDYVSTGEPTYWPTDLSKTPDLIDFCVMKGIDKNKITTESCLELSSDHSPIIITLHTAVRLKDKPPTLSNKKTNWIYFREQLDNLIDAGVSLKSAIEIEDAVQFLTNSIQHAAWDATPVSSDSIYKPNIYSSSIMNLIREKRMLRKKWQNSRKPTDKLALNRSIRQLKASLLQFKNDSVQEYLSGLSSSQATDYNLWKATKRLKQPQKSKSAIKTNDGAWTRTDKEKGETFQKHLRDVFKAHETETDSLTDNKIKAGSQSPFQMDLPIKNFKLSEIKNQIKFEINAKKAPGFDLITGKILKEVGPKCLALIRNIFNAVLRHRYFPTQWKVAKIIMIAKPGKNPEEVTAYRPISLLPILSKLLEKLILKRLSPIIDDRQLIPSHQFGFRNEHSTIEQVHRIVNHIHNVYEKKKYCSAIFLDISQAFDKVWHEGLLYKLKMLLPHHFYEIFKSYIENRYFFVKYEDEHSSLSEISSGVPQGSVLGPILYLLYTADLPLNDHTTIATYADDTAILSSHENEQIASRYLQNHINEVESWLQNWKIKVNESKSVHVTFTLRRQICPPVTINNKTIPQADDVKYLGIYLDRRLTWQKHIFTKRKQLGLKLRNMYWLIGHKSQLNLNNKLLIYKAILKPIWSYGIQLWGSASKSNIEIIQRFQNKILRIVTNAPWFVPNSLIENDLQIASVQDEIKKFSQSYRERLNTHPNHLTQNLMDVNLSRRLKRNTPSNL